MIQSKINYYEIPGKSILNQDLIDLIGNSDPWISYYHFNLKSVSYDLLSKDPFFQWLNSRYQFQTGILRSDPYTCYDWHVDTLRKVGINLLINTDVRSACLFSRNKQQIVFDIEELKYQPNTYYLFNTQILHSVYNFENTRYLLSVEFIKDSTNLSFNQLMEDIDKNYRLT